MTVVHKIKRAMQTANAHLFVMGLLVGVIALQPTAMGQWVHYPTAGVPRKADGSPNLTAPAPRLADGKPDFSGIWHTARRIPCTPELSRFIECGAEIGDRRSP
jgi:hypothetical protein